MKKIVALFACTLIATSAFAQGTINFNNTKPNKQIITDAAGDPATGGFAQLYAGTTADSLSAVGSPVALGSGKRAGYVTAGSVDVGFNGAGFFQVKAWKGADTFEAALESGMSNVIGLTPGDSTASPPGLPADLAGLEAFSLTVIPEPGTIALAVLGLAAFFVRRRK
ncbi:MAG: PEP-CTERM sorting domain-containing protein [Verrucomicrobiota bacterium]|jgi:hypothetical protein|nr:PEP-CTERM sorting domain-containing protein [Verrucomicrobiota bacterium]|tara:strand:- start:2135 stop:2635 length:501 start_codon:yes stop_codon:yes gene_type:complete